MKNTFLPLAILVACAASDSFAALTEYKTDVGGIWSNSSTWNVNPTSTYPNSNTVAAVGNNTNGGTLTVDGNYTIGAFYTGYAAKAFTIAINDGASLTIDAANDLNSLVMWSGGTRTIDDNLTIRGGNFKITNTANLGNSTVTIDMSKNNPTTFVKYINMDSTFTTTEHIKFVGYKKSNAVANLNTGISAMNGADTKNITVQDATVNLGGTTSKMGSLFLTGASEFTLNAGSTLNVAPTLPLQTASTNFAVCLNASNVMNINGALNISTIKDTDCFRNNGTVVVGKNGSMKISGAGWNNFNLYGGATLDISSGKNSVILPGSLRMSDKSTLILRGTNAINISAANNTCTALIQLSGNSGNHRIELYADNQLGTFAFAGKSTLTLFFGEGCNEFLLTDLSKNYDTGLWLGKLSDKDAHIVIENFRNDTFRVTNFEAILQSDLDRISADGWKDFFVTETGYINAIAVPEASTFAALLGLVALGFAIRRRKI